MFLVVLMYALFGSTFTFGKLALMYAKPIFLIGLRMTLAGTFLLGYLFVVDKKKLHIKKEHWYLFIPIILIHVYLAYVCEFWALRYLTAAKTCLLYSLSPFITAIFSYFYFSEHITMKKFIGLLFGTLGFLPVLMAPAAGEQAAFGFISWPELMMLVSVFSSVYGWIIFRRLTKFHFYSSFLINGVGMLGGGLLALGTSWLIEATPGVPLVTNWFAMFEWLLLLIIVANIICYNLYGYLLKRYTATFLSFAGFLCPLMAALFGWMFLGERVCWEFFFTLFLVVIGLYLFYQEELRQGYIVK